MANIPQLALSAGSRPRIPQDEKRVFQRRRMQAGERHPCALALAVDHGPFAQAHWIVAEDEGDLTGGLLALVARGDREPVRITPHLSDGHAAVKAPEVGPKP